VTGRAVASWRLPRAKVSERGVLDVERDYASFLDPAGIHVLRLTDGATAVIPTARIAPSGCKNRDVWAQMEPRGLVYASAPSSDELPEGCQRSQLGIIRFSELEDYLS
jgi:hypothetical protein